MEITNGRNEHNAMSINRKWAKIVQRRGKHNLSPALAHNKLIILITADGPK